MLIMSLFCGHLSAMPENGDIYLHVLDCSHNLNRGLCNGYTVGNNLFSKLR